MRTVTITVGTGAQGVTIGRRAENEATAVIFDVSALIETYGDGGAVLMVKRPTDADAYPATVERSGTSVTWTPTETDLAYKGMGEAELFWYVDGMLAKTAVYTINIRRDIGETTGEAPAPYDDWIATLTELGGQTAENAQRAEVARTAAETAATTATAAADTATAASTTATTAAQTATAAATTAQASATTATSAANTASTAAERAETAANNAEQDATSTEADRTAAEDAATRAATSASAAATSAGAAEISATQAAAGANSAATSAQTATTKAAEANTSAGTAAQNATTATVKAQEAAQSATQAAASATAAQTAQTAAEAAQTAAETAQMAAETAATSAEAEADRAEGYADRLIDVYPTDTASGSIASFPDGADSVEIKSAVVQIEPVQSGSGDPSPDNVRPISGWTGAQVKRAGVNVWDEQTKTGTFDNSTGAYNPDRTDIICTNTPIKVTPSTSYFLAFPSGVKGGNVYFYDSNMSFLSMTYNNANSVVTTPSECGYVNISFGSIYGPTYNNNISFNYPSSETAYLAYGGNAYPITWQSEAGTVYGGTLTYDGDGEWTVESACAIKTLTGTDTESWSVGSYSNFRLSVPDIAIVPQDELGVVACDALKAIPFANRGSTTVPCVMQAPDGTIVELRHMDAVGISTIAELKTWLASNNVTIVYKLAIHQTYTLTTEQVVSTLKGQNNFWSDSGDTSVTYRADIGLFIDKKLAALAAALS